MLQIYLTLECKITQSRNIIKYHERIILVPNSNNSLHFATERKFCLGEPHLINHILDTPAAQVWVSYFERQCLGWSRFRQACLSSQNVPWIIWHHYSSSKWIYCVEHSETDGGATTNNTINSHHPHPPPSPTLTSRCHLFRKFSFMPAQLIPVTKQTLPAVTQSATSPVQRRF